MTVQAIVATLVILAPAPRADDGLPFARLGFFLLLWLVIRLVVYVRAPIALYRMNTKAFNLHPRLLAADEPIDDEVLRAIERGEAALDAIGFKCAQRITSGDKSPIPSVESLLEHPVNGDLANVDAVLNSNPRATSRFVEWVSFRSFFADGTILTTSNLDRALVGFWPTQPTHESVTLPDISSFAFLYRLHRSRATRKGATVAQLHQSRGNTPEQRLEFAARESLEGRQFQVTCGYRKLSANGYSLTVRGATLSAWRRLFPWKQIIAWQGRRAAAEVVRLG